MALSSLPEEILVKISKYVALESHRDSLFYSLKPSSDTLLRCQDVGLQALASEDRQLRRICLPDLFSHVLIEAAQIAESLPLEAGLERLLQIAVARPHIAKCITFVALFLIHIRANA